MTSTRRQISSYSIVLLLILFSIVPLLGRTPQRLSHNPFLEKVFNRTHSHGIIPVHLYDRKGLRDKLQSQPGRWTSGESSTADSIILGWGVNYTTAIPDANDECFSLSTDPRDGSSYVSGASYSETSGFDYLTIKYDINGQTVWTRRYDGDAGGDDYAIGSVIDSSGNLYVTGFSMDADSVFNYLTIKYTPGGDIAWIQMYDGTGQSDDTPSAIAIDASGSVYVTGTSVGPDSTYDVVTIKYDSSGNALWVRSYASAENEDDNAIAMTIDNTGNIFIAGNTVDGNDLSIYLTIKYNAAGTQLWKVNYGKGGTQTCEISAITADPSGNIAVTGKLYSDQSDFDYYTIEYSPGGIQIWSARYDDSDNGTDEPTAIVSDGEGDVYVTGLSEGPDGSFDFATLKYNSIGIKKWTKRYTSADADDIPYFMAVDPSENIYITGSSSNGGGSYDFTTMKYNTFGTQRWITYYNGAGNSYDYPTDMQLDPSGNIVICGSSSLHGVNTFTTLKYIQFPALVFNSSDIAFPPTSVGCSSADSIIAKNNGSDTLVITSSYSPDENFTVLPSSATLAPGESCLVVMTFMPAASGSNATNVVFATNKQNSTPLLHVTGAGTGSGLGTRLSTTLGIGWQLISLPVAISCPVVYENPWIYRYGEGYISDDTLKNGIGYWRKLSTPQVSFAGYAVSQETINVNTRWNLIGSISYPVLRSSIHTVPANIILSQIYGYNNSGYFVADTLLPCRAYWVKIKQAGKIILNSDPSLAAGKNSVKQTGVNNFLTLTDATGKSHRLTLLDDNGMQPSEYYELPPPPPAGVFDARFASGRSGESFHGGNNVKIPIRISSVQYPLKVSWNITSQNYGLSLVVDHKTISLDGAGETVIATPASSLILRQSSGRAIPREYSLYQNYPNPFNPATMIRYDLPNDGHVLLGIIDILGQTVATVLDEQKSAGSYSVEFDASALPTGVYFYKIVSGNFVQVRKMLLVR